LTQEAYDELSNAFRTSYPQRSLLNRISPIDLPLPKVNYEFYAMILHGLFQKNPLSIEKTVDSIHQFVPHANDTAEEIGTAKKRTLYEALVLKQLDDIDCQNKPDELAGIIQLIKSKYSTATSNDPGPILHDLELIKITLNSAVESLWFNCQITGIRPKFIKLEGPFIT